MEYEFSTQTTTIPAQPKTEIKTKSDTQGPWGFSLLLISALKALCGQLRDSSLFGRWSGAALCHKGIIPRDSGARASRAWSRPSLWCRRPLQNGVRRFRRPDNTPKECRLLPGPKRGWPEGDPLALKGLWCASTGSAASVLFTCQRGVRAEQELTPA